MSESLLCVQCHRSNHHELSEIKGPIIVSITERLSRFQNALLLQWNLRIKDTLGPTVFVLCREVVLFRR